MDLKSAVHRDPERGLSGDLRRTEVRRHLRLVPSPHPEGVNRVARNKAIGEVDLAVDQPIPPHPPRGVREGEEFPVTGGFVMNASVRHGDSFRSYADRAAAARAWFKVAIAVHPPGQVNG